MSSATERSTAGSTFGGRLKNVFTNTKKQSSLENSSQPNTFEIWSVDNKVITIDLKKLRNTIKHDQLLVKDVVKDVCKKLDIYPKSAGFFGIKYGNTWLVQTQLVDKIDKSSRKAQKFIFMLQFKVLTAPELRKRDEKAYEYYIKQWRYDFKTGMLARQLEGKENEKILLRMVILEMMMVAKEENISPLKDVMKNRYKRYFSMDEILRNYNDRDGPRDVSKCKQKVEKSLSCFSKVNEPDKDFITEVELLPNYKEEIFHVMKYEGERASPNPIEIWITSTEIMKRAIIGNVKMTLWSSPFSQFHQLKACEYDNVKGRKVTILRGQDPPEMIYCSDEQMHSLFSFVEGYYQLLVNQYNSVLYDSCEYLQSGLYLGPIEREVALRILTSRGREQGTYLIREHTTVHGSFVLSLIKEDDNISHLIITGVELEDDKMCYKLDDARKFDSLEQLRKFYMDEKNSREIKAQLGKIITPKKAGEVPLYTDPALFRPILSNLRNPALLPGQLLGPPSVLDFKMMSSRIHLKNGAFGDVFKCETEDRRQLIVKRFPTLKIEMLNAVASILMQLQGHEHILHFAGVSIINDLFLAFEYLQQGSLERYLEEHSKDVSYGQLLKYLYQITDAITFLHEKGLIHADLRLSKFLLKDVNTAKLGDCCITWQLSRFKKLDERIFQKRFKHLAPEIFLEKNQEFTMKTDVWSYGLTIWQLFTLQKPFNNCNSTQLMQFFEQHIKMQQQPALLHLNMNILRYCPHLLFNIFTSSLHMLDKDRGHMADIMKVVQDLKTKAPSCHKEKMYFVYDWASDENMNDKGKKRILISSTSLDTNNYDLVESGNTTDSGNYSSDGQLSRDGQPYKKEDDVSIVEQRKEDFDDNVTKRLSPGKPLDGMDCDELDRKPSLKELDKDKTVDRVADIPKFEEDKTISERQNRSTTPTADVEKMDIDIPLRRKGSHSAPSSPTQHKIFRSSSVNESSKRGEEEFETASILVGMSQPKLHNKPGIAVSKEGLQSKDSQPHQQQKQPIFRVPPGYSIVGRAIGQPIPGQPMKFFPSQPNYMKGLIYPHQNHQTTAHQNAKKQQQQPQQQQQQQKQRPSSPSTQQQKVEDFSPRSPQPLPPDSPESVRRDFSEPPKREIPRDDKTRQFLQERINEERDRCRGKRSLSFNEEFDEYKNSTKKAAKRALLGHNPFNIGIQIPDNFLLPTEKRGYKANPVPSDVTRFFKQDVEPRSKEKSPPRIGNSTPFDPYKTRKDLENYVRSQQTLRPLSQQQQENSMLDPYKTLKDIEKYRREKLDHVGDKPNDSSPSTETPSYKPHPDALSAYKAPPMSEMQNVVKGIQELTAHSPKPFGFEENSNSNRRVYNISDPRVSDISSKATTSTVTIYSTHQHPTTMYMPSLPSVQFPYARADSAIPSSMSLSSVSRAGPRGKIGYTPHQNIPAYPVFPLLTMNQVPYTRPRLPVEPVKYPPTPPTLIPAPSYTTEHAFHPPAVYSSSPGVFTPVDTNGLKSKGPYITGTGSLRENTSVKQEPIDSNESKSTKSKSMPNVSTGGAPTIFSPNAAPIPTAFRPPPAQQTLKRHIKKEDLSIHKCIGRGQFGTVHKGIWRFTDPKTNGKRDVSVAIKRLNKDTPLTNEAIEDLRKEADAMAILTNDSQGNSEGANHIIKMYGVCDEQDGSLAFSIVTELAEGALDYYVCKKKRELGKDGVGYCLFYAKQIATGMEYLHSHKVIHRDLACRNILVMQKELVKISDFGLSRIFTETDYYRCSEDRVVPYPWLAIESMEKKIYTVETDYWSFGVTLWELFTVLDEKYQKKRAVPYEDIKVEKLHSHLEQGYRLAKPPSCPEKLWNEMMLLCWDKDPNKRPSFYLCARILKDIMDDIGFCLGQ